MKSKIKHFMRLFVQALVARMIARAIVRKIGGRANDIQVRHRF